MRRKIIQLAGKTLVISLPYRWAQDHHIKKGQEVELEPHPRGLLIAPAQHEPSKTRALDVSGLDASLNRVLGALYKQGASDVHLRNVNPAQLQTIRATLQRTCLGFEIVDSKQQTVHIKNITTLNPADFDQVLRRLFLSVLQMLESLADLPLHPSKAAVQDLQAQDDFINKYADFCRRVLNQEEHRPHALYYLVEELERLGDACKELATVPRTIAGRKTLGQVPHIFRAFYEHFYAFDLEQAEQQLKHNRALLARAAKNPQPPLAEGAYRIIRTIHEMYGAVFVLKL